MDHSLCVCSVAKSCLTLCDPIDYSLPSSSVHGIFKARILEWVAIFFPWDLPNPDGTLVSCISCIGRQILYHWAIWEARVEYKSLSLLKNKKKVWVTQSCPTLYISMDYSQLVSSVHGILQARILECVAIPFSRGSSQPRDWTLSPALQVDSLPPELPGKPLTNDRTPEL